MDEVPNNSGPTVIPPENPVTQPQPEVKPEKPKKKISLAAVLLFGFIVVVTVLAIGAIFYARGQTKVATITDFESCAAAGNPIMESYPEQCSANGQTFTRVLTEEEQKKLSPDSSNEASPSATANWKTYANNSQGYYFKYPPGFELTSTLDTYISLENDEETVNIETYNYSVGDEPYNFDKFALEKILTYCAADGPTGSNMCDKAISQNKISTLTGNEGHKYILNLVESRYENGSSTIVEQRPWGPIYVIPGKKPQSIIVFSTNYDNDAQKNTSVEEIMDNIVSTIQFTL